MKRAVSFALALLVVAVPLVLFETVHAPVAHGVQPIFGEFCAGIYVNTTMYLRYQATSATGITDNALIHYAIKRSSDGQIFRDAFQAGGGNAGGGGIRIPYEGCLLPHELTMYTTATGSGALGGSDTYAQLMMTNFPLSATSTGRGQGNQNIPNTSNAYITAVLLGICANNFYTYTWPDTPVASPEACLPSALNIAPSNPAAGANSLNALPNGNRYRVINVRYTLATSATAGNRFACVQFLSGGTGGTIIGAACAPYAQQASQTVTYEFAAGVGWATNCNQLGTTQTALLCAEVMVPLPSYWETVAAQETSTGATFSVNTAVLASANTSGLLAGDQISGVVIRTMVWNAND